MSMSCSVVLKTSIDTSVSKRQPTKPDATHIYCFFGGLDDWISLANLLKLGFHVMHIRTQLCELLSSLLYPSLGVSKSALQTLQISTRKCAFSTFSIIVPTWTDAPRMKGSTPFVCPGSILFAPFPARPWNWCSIGSSVGYIISRTFDIEMYPELVSLEALSRSSTADVKLTAPWRYT